MPALVVVTRFVGLAGHKKIASNDVCVCVGVGGSALSAAIRIGIPNGSTVAHRSRRRRSKSTILFLGNHASERNKRTAF